MADIYGFEGSVRAEQIAHPGRFIVTVDGATVGLAQNVQVSFNQQLGPLFGMNTGDTFITSQRLRGTMLIGQFISAVTPLHSVFGSALTVAGQGASVDLTATDPGVSFGITLLGCFVNNIGASADANGNTILENLSVEFFNLCFSAGGGGGVVATAG